MTSDKDTIVKRLETERQRLEASIATLCRDDMLRPGVVNAWSVKDVLAHLADWEAHMLAWVKAARNGDPVASPEPGLTWNQWDVFNQRVYERHRNQPLAAVLRYFRNTHRRFMAMVEAMPGEEMLTRGRYDFLGKDTIYKWLGAYANHDRWGKTAIRKWLKSRLP